MKILQTLLLRNERINENEFTIHNSCPGLKIVNLFTI